MKVKELLKDPNKWTKQVYARDAHGREVDPTDLTAVCFCIHGALHFAYRACEDRIRAMDKIEQVIVQLNLRSDSIAAFNDYATHEDVVALLELADV